jgi:hypothetical protein
MCANVVSSFKLHGTITYSKSTLSLLVVKTSELDQRPETCIVEVIDVTLSYVSLGHLYSCKTYNLLVSSSCNPGDSVH